jgi:hypothetical protein
MKSQHRKIKSVKVGRKKISSNPATAVVTYLGPLITPSERRQQDLYTMVTHTDGLVGTGGAGTSAPVFTSYPGAPGGGLGAPPDWAGLAGIYDEYRTLAFEVRCFPIRKYDPTSLTLHNEGGMVVDYDSNAALTNLGQADRYSSCVYGSTYKTFSNIARMSGPENSQFIGSGITTPTMWIKMWFDTLTISVNYWHVTITYRLQFRGKGL